MIDSTDLSPRLTAVFDIKGDGKMLITGSASRLYNVVPLEVINSYLLDEWNGFNAIDISLFIPGAGYVSPLGSLRPGQYWDYVDQGLIPEPDIEAYYRDEAIVGFEWQFSQNWAFSGQGDLVGARQPDGLDPAAGPQRPDLHPDRPALGLSGYAAGARVRGPGGGSAGRQSRAR